MDYYNDGTKEVYFHEYCPKCKHKDLGEFADPCFDCLAEPTNVNSHKPVYFEEVSKKSLSKTKPSNPDMKLPDAE